MGGLAADLGRLPRGKYILFIYNINNRLLICTIVTFNYNACTVIGA